MKVDRIRLARYLSEIIKSSTELKELIEKNSLIHI